MLGMFKRIAIFSLLCFVFVGCDAKRPQTPGIYVNESRHVLISAMRPDDVIVIVNGVPQTRRDYDLNLAVRENVYRLEAGIQLGVKDERVDDYMRHVSPYGVMELIHHELFRQYAEKCKLSPTEEAVKAQERQFLTAIGHATSSVEELGKLIGGEAGREFAKLPYIQSRDCLLRQSITSNDLSRVSDEEIAAREKYVRNFDANAKRMNDLSRKRLFEVKDKLSAGRDFAEVTKEYAQVHPEFGVEWGEFQLVDFPSDEPLHAWLVKAKVGDVSDPVDLEDGLAIVKLVGKGKGPALPDVQPPDTYRLVRCTVYAFQYMEHQERAEMSRQLLEWKVQDAQQQLGMKLMSEAVLEYPNGTNLFDTVDLK